MSPASAQLGRLRKAWAAADLKTRCVWLSELLAAPNPRQATQLPLIVDRLIGTRESVRKFIDECCDKDQHSYEQADALLVSYNKWAVARGDDRLNWTSFGCALRQLGFHRRKSSVNFWHGLRLRPVRGASRESSGTHKPAHLPGNGKVSGRVTV
ncbi:MAG: hypothetical protein HYX37_14810 [Rhizobiales bacterium]|nr:hypothetical protein [Hyphomicrobiales bacterium]